MKCQVSHKMRLLLFIVVLCRVNSLPSSPLCPGPDWLFHKESNKCFYLKDVENLNFFESHQYCDKAGYDMAVAKTQDVVDFLAENYEDQGDFWLGLTDYGTGKTTWADGSQLATNELWDTDFPTETGSSNQCVYLSVASKKLRDSSCYERRYKPVCQLEEVNDCRANEGRCAHKCIITGLKQSVCQCDPGYKLDGKYECKDLNECEYNNGGCDQGCNNTIGSYNCLCDTENARLGGRICGGERSGQSLDATELISILLTVLFPVSSTMTCIFMAIWRKNKIVERKPDKPVNENEVAVEEEQAEENEHYEEHEHEENFEYNEEEEFDYEATEYQ